MNQVSVGLIRDLLPRADSLWQRSIPLKKFHVFHDRNCFAMEMDRGGFAVDRAELDFEMAKHAQQLGVQFLSPAKAKLIDPPPQIKSKSGNNTAEASGADHRPANIRQVQTTIGGKTYVIESKIVIIASGLGNRVASPNSPLQSRPVKNSRVGVEAIYDTFPDQYRCGVLTMAIGDDGYVGLTHIGNDRLHVAAAVDRRALRKKGPQNVVADMMQQSGAPALDQANVAWRGTPPLTAKPNRIAQDRVFLIGDAAGYVEPFTGEGIRWALESGIGVAPFVVDAVAGYDPQLESNYRHWHRRTIVHQQKLCQRLSAGLKRPILRWTAHQVLRWRPRIADSIIRRINS